MDRRLDVKAETVRRDEDYMGRKMQLVARIKWERPRRRYVDVVNEDMQEVGAREDGVFDRRLWDNPKKKIFKTCYPANGEV